MGESRQLLSGQWKKGAGRQETAERKKIDGKLQAKEKYPEV